jgi:flagellar motor protein MotB
LGAPRSEPAPAACGNLWPSRNAAGLSKDHVSAAGYGPNRPAVEGASKEALQQNRRVEILMIEG